MTRHKHTLDGERVSEKLMAVVAKSVAAFRAAGEGLTLATLQVGHAKDTVLYSKFLGRTLDKLGIDRLESVSEEKISEAVLIEKVRAFNDDPTVTGILVFSPLPAHIHASYVLDAIDVSKDVEGRRVLAGNGDRVVSPTAAAAMALLEDSGIEVAGKDAVVIGHSDVVGKPAAILLMDKMATVTVCHVKTKNLQVCVERSDIVVAAAGKPGLVKGAWIKPGAVVIDVGENVVGGKVVGDVEFDEASKRAGFITPVPGGVGPVTNVMLASNLLKLHRLRKAG